MSPLGVPVLFFFFNDTATTEIYTLSLHDALPIWCSGSSGSRRRSCRTWRRRGTGSTKRTDRKSTRLNSSHLVISYAVFCLKKKKYRQDDYTLDGKSLTGDEEYGDFGTGQVTSLPL